MIWQQNYDPLGHWVLSTLAAGLPVLVLLGLLVTEKAGVVKAAMFGLGTAIAVASAVFHMRLGLIVASAGAGLVFAFFRIIWLIGSAVFLFDLAVETGQFEIMKRSIAGLSSDRRLQAVLVAFCFGALVEGSAGFGAPVAISAAFLVGLGFDPFKAALLCLIANTAPVAWGGVGTPLVTLAKVSGLDVHALSATSGRILPFLSFLIPFWLVRTMCSWRETFEVAVPLTVIGGVFALAQGLWSNLVGYELVDIVSSVGSLAAGVIVVKLWRPRQTWRFPGEAAAQAPAIGTQAITPGAIFKAWTPFALLTICVFIWGLPAIKSLGTPSPKTLLDAVLSWKLEVPGLHLQIARGESITGHAAPTPEDLEPAVMDIVPLSSTGTAVFAAALLSGLVLRVPPGRMAELFARTMRRMLPAFAAIFCMLALGFVTKSAGMDAVLGLAFTRVGPTFYPFFAAALGWLGVALTGSDTSSNVLFGNLQRITAIKLDLSPVLMASANTTGGVMGKMIDAQSIVVATAATGEVGHEGDLLRAVLKHSVALMALVGIIVWIYAHVFPQAVVGQ